MTTPALPVGALDEGGYPLRADDLECAAAHHAVPAVRGTAPVAEPHLARSPISRPLEEHTMAVIAEPSAREQLRVVVNDQERYAARPQSAGVRPHGLQEVR